jgi:hypothetical protein
LHPGKKSLNRTNTTDERRQGKRYSGRSNRIDLGAGWIGAGSRAGASGRFPLLGLIETLWGALSPFNERCGPFEQALALVGEL